MHFFQPNVSVGIQEVIINFVPKEKGNVENSKWTKEENTYNTIMNHM